MSDYAPNDAAPGSVRLSGGEMCCTHRQGWGSSSQGGRNDPWLSRLSDTQDGNDSHSAGEGGRVAHSLIPWRSLAALAGSCSLSDRAVVRDVIPMSFGAVRYHRAARDAVGGDLR